MQKRIGYLDWLRVFSIFSVIILHASAQNWHGTDINGLAWQTFNFYDSIVRWAVPVFVMISGCLLLQRDIPISQIYRKYVGHLVTAFLSWSVFYACFHDGDFLDFIVNVLHGEYHMWFIPMIIGLYIALPIIKLIVQKQNIMRYFLSLSFVFAFLLPWLSKIIHDFCGHDAIAVMNALNRFIQPMGVKIVSGFAGYFILGYYLHVTNINRKNRIIIYILGILGLALTVFLQVALALKIQNRHQNYYDVFTINVLPVCIAIFVWFKYTKFFEKPLRIIEKLSRYTLGIYMVHVFILVQLSARLGLNTLSFNPILSVPAVGIVVFIISAAVSAILHQIPLVKKYCV